MKRNRPGLTIPIRRLIRDVAQRMPAYAHIRAEQILVIAGEARRASHASVRPLGKMRGNRIRPLIRIRGGKILYLITLRPIWFRASTPEQRVATLLHELFHISKRFDGSLHAGRRHATMGPRFGMKLAPLVRRYLLHAPKEVLAPFRFRGLVRVPMWLEKPPESLARDNLRVRRRYTEAQLFIGLARMK